MKIKKNKTNIKCKYYAINICLTTNKWHETAGT